VLPLGPAATATAGPRPGTCSGPAASSCTGPSTRTNSTARPPTPIIGVACAGHGVEAAARP
jgi:hypothetical protein